MFEGTCWLFVHFYTICIHLLLDCLLNKRYRNETCLSACLFAISLTLDSGSSLDNYIWALILHYIFIKNIITTGDKKKTKWVFGLLAQSYFKETCWSINYLIGSYLTNTKTKHTEKTHCCQQRVFFPN